MTITLAWWWIPVVLFIIPFVAIALMPKAGDYDSATPLFGLMWVVGCWGSAIAFTVAKLFFA